MDGIDQADSGSKVVFQVFSANDPKKANLDESPTIKDHPQRHHTNSVVGRSASESTVFKSERNMSKQQLKKFDRDLGARLVTEENFQWEKGEQLEMKLDEDDSVSKLSSVSMRVDSKISLQEAMAAEKKMANANTKEQNKNLVKRHMHQLQCRIEDAFLPLSVDLLPSNDI